MSFTFAHSEMKADLDALSDGAAKFLTGGSTRHLKQLAQSLQFALADARKSDTPEFSWKTSDDLPIRIKESTNWKGVRQEGKCLFAEVKINYVCDFLPDPARLRVKSGATEVTLRRQDEPNALEKVFHFDAEEGGWEDRAGHPPLHFQCHGLVNDIPRLPCLIVHPVDVISFVILELHQSHWRKHVTDSQVRAKLRKVPEHQRTRLQKIAMNWMEALSNTSDHGLVILQRRMPQPLEL